MDNAIVDELDRQAAGEDEPQGAIARIAASYNLESERLLGLLLKLDFEASHIVTCDAWKRQCGGVPRGSFVIFRVDPRAVAPGDRAFCSRMILARITDAVPTPVEANVQQTLFQVHKLQAQLDPLTHQDLQWGALKASIVGTFYDDGDKIGFGNDVESFFSPFAYVAYMPTNEHLGALINSFVQCDYPFEIGRLRYTETPSPQGAVDVPILIDPRDIVGQSTAAQRLANFGKTRFGKSNSNKMIARAIFESGLDVAQVFFDPSGEYTYINDQDQTCVYALHHERSVRYSLTPRALREDEAALGLEPAQLLRVNFYETPSVGHALIVSLWDTENPRAPMYWRPVLDWDPADPIDAPDRRRDISGFNHYWRTMGMWYAILHRAGYTPPDGLRAPITFRAPVKEELVRLGHAAAGPDGSFIESGQPIAVLPQLYRSLAQIWAAHQGEDAWFPTGDGLPYFNEVEAHLLRMLSDTSIAAHTYIRPFNQYHSPDGSSVFDDIAEHAGRGTSVFIDMSQSNDVVRGNLVERICRTIFARQNQRFNSQDGVGDRFVVFYFEEAHRLFHKDDSDLNSIYNLLAKEGAKLNIGMVYSTQSMTTVSPDLVKNTDNFLIAHLDDDREAREVTRKYAFRDVADDVQRIQSRGYVRMLTRSHRFALPVQIHRFAPPVEQRDDVDGGA